MRITYSQRLLVALLYIMSTEGNLKISCSYNTDSLLSFYVLFTEWRKWNCPLKQVQLYYTLYESQTLAYISKIICFCHSQIYIKSTLDIEKVSWWDENVVYIYVWKLNKTVLELDYRAVKFLFSPRRDLNSHH